MELRHLRYFAAVAEKQNVSRAAQELHVSQPALSRQIRDLESELGFDLLERTAKSVSLTKAGRVFFNEVKQVLHRVDEAVAKARSTAFAKAKELHVGYAPSPTADFLPLLLRAYKHASSARVVLHDLSSDEMLEGLLKGRLQAALTVEQPSKLPEEIMFERLSSYSVGIAAAPTHPLAAKKGVTPSEVIKEALVAYSRKEYPDYHQRLRQWLGVPARKLKIVEKCDGILSLIAAVESERGIALTSQGVMALAGNRLKYIPLKPAPEPIFVGICYRRKDLKDSSVKLFLETARKLTGKKSSEPAP